MNRRTFLQSGSLSVAATVLHLEAFPAARTERPRPHRPIGPPRDAAASPVREAAHDGARLPAEPFLELHGGPVRQSCSGLAHYGGVSFERMSEDILHHRVPPEWRERLILGIEEPAT